MATLQDYPSTGLSGHRVSAYASTSAAEREAVAREVAVLSAERAWLIAHILPRLLSGVREGLAECRALMRSASVTLPLSSRETECLKGVVTRRGARLVKGNLLIKLRRLHAKLKLDVDPTAADSDNDPDDDDVVKDKDKARPNTTQRSVGEAKAKVGIVLPQLELVVSAIDAAVRTLSGDILRADASLALVDVVDDLLSRLRAAEASLEGSDDLRRLFPSPSATPTVSQRPASRPATGATPAIDAAKLGRLRDRVGHRFPHGTLPSHTFAPALTENVVVDLYVRECAVVCEVVLLADRPASVGAAAPLLSRLARTLLPPPATSSRTGSTPGAKAKPGPGGPGGSSASTTTGAGAGASAGTGMISTANTDPNLGEFVRYKGRDVKVIERVKVASQDPALIACGAKLSSLVHALEQIRSKLVYTQA